MTDKNIPNAPGGFQPDVEPTNAPIPQPVMPGQPVPPVAPVAPAVPVAESAPPVEPMSPATPVEPVVPVSEPVAAPAPVVPTMPAEPASIPVSKPVMPVEPAAPASAPVPPATPAPAPVPTSAPATPGQPIQPPAGYVAPTGAPVPPGQPVTPSPSPNAPSVDPNATPQGSFGHVGSFENPNVNNVPNGGSGTAALIFGILAVVFALLMPIIGVILGIVAIVLAGRAVRRSGKNGKTTGGRVCGIIGIVLSVVIFAASFALVSSVIGEYEDEGSSSNTSIVGETSEEKAVIAVVETELDKLVNKDASAVQMVANINDKAFEEDAEMTMAEAGMDSEAFAKWALEDLSYTIDSVYVYDDGAATVYVDVEIRDAYSMVNSFATDLEDFIDSADAGSMTMTEAKNKIGSMFDDAMGSFDGSSEVWYCSFDLVEKNGTWVIDSEDWDYEMEFLFEVF